MLFFASKPGENSENEAVVNALQGHIPRGLPDHRTLVGKEYGAFCRAKLARLPLPRDAFPTLREAALIAVDELPKVAAKKKN